MKKLICLALALALLIIPLTSCDFSSSTNHINYSEKYEYYQSELGKINQDLGVPSPPKVESGKSQETVKKDSYTVYVSDYGKIHKNPNCSGMKYYKVMSYSEAVKAGYSRCQNCY